MQIPIATPAAIAELIKSAYVLSWGDYEACLNRIRVCLEMLLDALRIPRSALKAGRRNPLNLHRRIELAQGKGPSTKPFLMAAKYLGNAGSHSGGLTRRDAFDAFDLLEAIVTALYGEQKNVARLALKDRKKTVAHSNGKMANPVWAAARYVLHHHSLLQAFAQGFGDRARQRIGQAARRIGDDQLQRLFRPRRLN